MGGSQPGLGTARGCPHPDVQSQAPGPLPGGAAQAEGLQDVAAAAVGQEAPGVQVHLVARRLEVEGHCGDSGTGCQGGDGSRGGCQVGGARGSHPAGSQRSTSPGGCSWQSSS